MAGASSQGHRRRVSSISAVSSLEQSEQNQRTRSVSPIAHNDVPLLSVTSAPNARPNTSSGDSEGFQKSTNFADNSSSPVPSAKWLPYTLRGYLVWIPAAVSFILGLTIMLLWWYSDQHDGLSTESSAVLGWRFVPTLLAIVYTQLTTMLFEDVKRTEPFARLGVRDGKTPSALHTILDTPHVWWVALKHAFHPSRNGGRRSWIMILSCLVNVFAFLLISPFSSALLDAQETIISQPFMTTRLMLKGDPPLAPTTERDTYFRTTGAILQNVSTSPWISDDYTVLPFWPSDTSFVSWDEQVTTSPQTWQAETTVFRTELQCFPLELAATAFMNVTALQDEEVREKMPGYQNYTASMRVDSAQGCQYNLTFGNSDLDLHHENLLSWAHIDEFASEGLQNPNFRSYYNERCKGSEVIFLSSGWFSGIYEKGRYRNEGQFLPNLTVSSYMCSTDHYMAMLPVTASISNDALKVSFNTSRFHNIKKPVPEQLLNQTQFYKVYTDPKWYEYIASQGQFYGALAMLASQYDFNATRMRTEPTIQEKAARIRGRHFGELLRASLEESTAPQTGEVDGKRSTIERRVVVQLEVAVTVATLFFLSSIMLLWIIWLSRLARRPLNLTHDPATVLGCMTIVASNESLLSSLRGLDQATKRELEQTLSSRMYYTSPGLLQESSGGGRPVVLDSSQKGHSGEPSEIPALLGFWTLSGLFAYLAALLIAIAVLYKFANEDGLYRSLFTYHVEIGGIGSFSPFSIIPTVFGIILGLWWNGLDKLMRTLQPYISMAKSPTDMAHGAAVSYQSSYWLWASAKAAKNKHWLLSLVTFGTVVAQALIVVMSALFQQNVGYLHNTVKLERSLELRQTPHLRQVFTTDPFQFSGSTSGYGFVRETLETLYTNLSTNWMYTAEIQLTMDKSEPVWNKEGWSFVPVNISGIDRTRVASNLTDPDMEFASVYYSPVNVTLDTPAIRGRVECKPIQEVNDTEKWLETPRPIVDERTNITWNASSLPNGMFGRTPYSSYLTPDAFLVQCCGNYTDPALLNNFSAPLTVGYWTEINNGTYKTVSFEDQENIDNNFTVKWIHGKGGVINPGNFGTVIFPTPPRMQALSCTPIIETSPASIVINMETEQIESYRLLEDPVPDETAWTEYYVLHNLTSAPDPALLAERLKIANESYSIGLTLPRNMTTSYGIYFMNAMLRASRLSNLDSRAAGHGSTGHENLLDNTFNIRNNRTGLNLDFMSYAMYLRAKRDSAALLDADVLRKHTQKVFTTFFQHYVSSQLSLEKGGWAYQPIGANLDGIGAKIINPVTALLNRTSKAPVARPAQNTQREFEAMTTERVEVLHMSSIAFIVCVVLLGWLIITTLVVVAIVRWHIRNLPRNIQSIADVVVLVAGSDKLLALVREKGVDGLKNQRIKTRLGPFRDSEGNMRWGIEVLEDGEVLMK